MDLIIKERSFATWISNKDNRQSVFIHALFCKILLLEAVVWRCLIKKVVIKISKNSQEKSCVRNSLIKLQACSIKKQLQRRCFAANFAKFSRANIVKHQRVAASRLHELNVIQARMLLLQRNMIYCIKNIHRRFSYKTNQDNAVLSSEYLFICRWFPYLGIEALQVI